MSRPRGQASDPRRPARLIAAAVRRLVDGHDPDPESALRHAAVEAGIKDSGRIPPISEVIESALAERRLFGGTAHVEQLQRLRHVALDAMRFLADFSPRLVGGVLEGWAGTRTGVELQVFVDDREALQLRLSELGMQPRVEKRVREDSRETDGHERLHFLAGEVPITLAVLPSDRLRQRTTARGRARATIADLELLIASATPRIAPGDNR